jgi:peptidoglycan biosynthesis protein MviN/MurJ (putative lipid II flippase)
MPAHAVAPLTPYISMAAFAFIYYRRIRRSFGRQQWKPTRAIVRLSVLAFATTMLVLAACFLPHLAPGVVLGALLGAGLGLFSLRHTHTEWADGSGWYTPNPWIGGALSAVLLGRLIWRWSQGAFSMGAGANGQNASPLTMGIAAALVVYSLVHVGGLWLRMRSLRPPTAPPTPPATVG